MQKCNKNLKNSILEIPILVYYWKKVDQDDNSWLQKEIVFFQFKNSAIV